MAMWLSQDLRLYPAGPLGIDVNAYCKGAAVKYWVTFMERKRNRMRKQSLSIVDAHSTNRQ